MPGLNFQKRFSQAVKDGINTQTIRKRRTPPIEEGQHLTMWTGQRTKNCYGLGDATCTKVEPIKIILERSEIWVWDEESEWFDEEGVYGQFKMLSRTDAEKFAIADGFQTLDEFFEFFKRYPSDVLHFELVVIHWRLGWDFARGRTPRALDSAPPYTSEELDIITDPRRNGALRNPPSR